MKKVLQVFLLTIIAILISSCTCRKFKPYYPKSTPTKQSISTMPRMTPPAKDWKDLSFYVKLHMFSYYGYSGSCTGNVISASDSGSSIVTAAHCLFGDKTMVLVERYDGKFFIAEDFKYHPFFPILPDSNDVGLVFLKENIDVKPIPIVLLGYAEPGEPVKLGGFRHSIDSEVKFEQGILIVNYIDEYVIRTRYTGIKDDYYPCFGSSGGGLIKLGVNEKREYELVGIIGIVSSGNVPCHQVGNIAQYTNIFQHIDYIFQNVPDVKLIIKF